MKTIFLLCLFLTGLTACAQNETLLKPGRVIFYNVENLFDTLNDPNTHDEEFLPGAEKEWNTQKYQLKLKHTAKVLSEILDTVQPLVIGLSEIENKKVLEDLILQPVLKKFDLGIIHHNSEDERGIDVAFLYNKDRVENVVDATLKIELGGDDKTRDILYFKANLTEANPVWFFVNHWPSRRGGAEESDSKRVQAAKTLKSKVENILWGEPNAQIVIMGDFNDNPGNNSLQILSGKADKKNNTLVNLMRPLEKQKEFTLKFKSESDVFDQFVVSPNLLNKNNAYYVSNAAAHIFNPRWLLYNHNKYGLIPNRTFTGNKWVKGYSDHLPVYFDLIFK